MGHGVWPSEAGFLNFGASDIWGERALCCRGRSYIL